MQEQERDERGEDDQQHPQAGALPRWGRRPPGAAWSDRCTPIAAMNVAVRHVQGRARRSTFLVEMPNQGAMAQLSRPYQIGLAAVAVLAAGWLLLFHGHSANSGSPGSAQVASTPAHVSGPPPTKAEGTAGRATGHGSASSLGALGHAVEKAHGAVATSEQNAKQLSEHSRRASSETTTTSTSRPAETTAAPSKTKGSNTTSTPATSATPGHAVTKVAPNSSPTKAAAPKAAAPGAAQRNPAATAQHRVEAQLAQGKVAVILFWDPKGAEDRLVHSALRSLRGDHSLDIAIDEATPGQVATFGTITRGVQVYGTPTMLFVDGTGQDGHADGLAGHLRDRPGRPRSAAPLLAGPDRTPAGRHRRLRLGPRCA